MTLTRDEILIIAGRLVAEKQNNIARMIEENDAEQREGRKADKERIAELEADKAILEQAVMKSHKDTDRLYETTTCRHCGRCITNHPHAPGCIVAQIEEGKS